jgi:ribosomal protein S18 acetylase RimI-like enzyme
LDPERQRRIGRIVVEESVARQVERLRADEGFPNQAFVAKTDDGTLVGFVWVARTHNDSTGQLEASQLNQYVAESYRGRGLGHRLIEAAEEWARQQGLLRISLSVGARNRLGQRLYESLGYQVETLRMTKRLSTQEDDEIRLSND